MSSIKQKALDLLSRRDHSRRELMLKLQRRGFAYDEIIPLLSNLQNDNLLNEDRFIGSFIRSRRFRGDGPLKICAQLQNRGIDTTRIFANEEWLIAEWQEAADLIRIKRFGRQPPSTRAEFAKQARYLQQRGYTSEQIRKALQYSQE